MNLLTQYRKSYQQDIKKIELVCNPDGKITGKTDVDINALKFIRAPSVFDKSYYNKVEGMALVRGYIVTPREELKVCQPEKELVTAQRTMRQDQAAEYVPCPYCKGEQYVQVGPNGKNTVSCPICKGFGKVEKDKKKAQKEVETTNYTIDDLKEEGRAKEKGITEEDVDQEQLKAGVEVEKEHTSNVDIAKKISLDHISEITDYYTRLKKMEDDAKSSKQASYNVYNLNFHKNKKKELDLLSLMRYALDTGGNENGQAQTGEQQHSEAESSSQKIEEPIKQLWYPNEAYIRALADNPQINLGDPTGYILGGKEKIEAAIARMQSNYFGVELFPTLFDKAAVLLESIAMTHPFENANKRVATEAAMHFLGENGLFLDDDFNEDEVIDVVLKLVNHQMTQEQLRDWLITQFSESEN